MFFSFNYHFSFLLCLIFFISPCITSTSSPSITRSIEHYKTTPELQNIQRFIGVKKGNMVNGISQIKKYLQRFGYLALTEINITDLFDAEFESALMQYQSKQGLTITGKLDYDTLSQIVAPRCGVSDNSHRLQLHATKHYVYFQGKPRWARQIPMTLSYAFSPDYMIDYIRLTDIKDSFRHAFTRWASVIPVSFIETNDYGYADIKIGFYRGDHGDGEPFDGPLGVLAHAFSPETGKFHLDADERWAVNFDQEKSKVAIDLESVATHEIGHLLGLAHSNLKESVMYPSLKPRDRKVELKLDDIQGVQSLYGSNPNFNVGTLSESDTSDNEAADLRIGTAWMAGLMLTMIFSLCI